ncbi:glycosyltransferase family 61 protein [Paenibacillus sp. RC67]|uniref:glycosyltransferase family 61 protein n=1 Tax=Paenibacillus sp. RC67 TaxID=3039392 RepID=UPI0024AD760C|nr:glycosyltransferase family 61 protein [Paenibacillus sp. RC67]
MTTNEERILPVDYYPDTWSWVQETFADAALRSEYYKVIYPAETLHLATPKGVDPPRWSLDCHFKEAYVAVIPNGRLFGSNAYVVTPNNKRIQDTEFPFPYDMELASASYTPETVATLIWGLNMPSIQAYTQSNYGHWLIDIISRYHLLEQSGIPIDKYVIGKITGSFQIESLQRIGIPLEKVVIVDDERFHLQAARLVVPSVPCMIGGVPRWACQYIRSCFKEQSTVTPVKGFERLYVSRQDAKGRFVINENEVMDVLEKKGFKKVLLGSLTIQEQVNLFSSVKVVVAPTGANNTNFLFCHSGTKVIEFSARTMRDSFFCKLASYVNLDYYHMECEIELPPKVIGGVDNIIVDIDKMNNVLNKAGV